MSHNGDSSLLVLKPLGRDLLATIVMCGPNVSSLFNFLSNQDLSMVLYYQTHFLANDLSPAGAVLHQCAQLRAWAELCPARVTETHCKIQHHCLRIRWRLIHQPGALSGTVTESVQVPETQVLQRLWSNWMKKDLCCCSGTPRYHFYPH